MAFLYNYCPQKWAYAIVAAFEVKVFVSSVNAGCDGNVLVMVNGEFYHAKPVEALEDDDDLLKVSVKYAYPTDAPEKQEV